MRWNPRITQTSCRSPGRPYGRLAGVFFCTLLLTGATGGTLLLQADERPDVPVSFQPGVLELTGSTAISVNYQNESGGLRESTQLRITPSIGYFIVPGLEIMVHASYILDIVHNEDRTQHLSLHDHSDAFLFTLGPSYNVYQLSNRFVPYGGLLLGTYYRNVSTGIHGAPTSRSDLMLALGLEAGMRWMLTENLSMRTGFQYVHGFREEQVGSTNYLGMEVGFSVLIPTWPSLSKGKPSTP